MEEFIGRARVAMISEVLWRTQYGGDPGAIGKRLVLNDGPVEIVGVLPLGFRFPYQTDVVVPLRETADARTAASEPDYGLIGRIRAGVRRETARAELALIGQRLASPSDVLGNRAVGLLMRDEPVPRNANMFMPMPAVFLGAALFVLLIACANVANLFLVRAAELTAVLAILASLGAGRGRLIRQVLAETLLLGGVGAAVGTALSAWLIRLALHFMPTSGFPSWFHVALDGRVLAFAVLVTMLVTVAVGLTPAREGTRFDLVKTLKRGGDGGAAATGIARSNKRGLAVQLAFSVALFVGAALFVRSYQRLSHIDPGYPAERIATVNPLFEPARYPSNADRLRFAEQIAARAATLPGVSATAVRGRAALRVLSARTTPRDEAAVRMDSRLIPDQDTTRALRMRPFPSTVAVSDGFFAMLGLRIHQGRGFAPDDVEGSAPVTVVSSRVAKLLWGTANAVGHSIQVGARGPVMTVIGVVADVGQVWRGPDGSSVEPVAMLYITARQAEIAYPEILATGNGDPLTVRGRVVDAVRAADPSLILSRAATLASQFDAPRLETRIFGGLIGVFAAVALILSIIGIYGVVAFGVARRTRELGIRIALGGTSRDVMRVVVLGGLRFVGIGIGIGLLLAVALGRVLKLFLFGVSPLDPVAYVAVALLFGAVAIVSCYLPARRVLRIDPLIALRSD